MREFGQIYGSRAAAFPARREALARFFAARFRVSPEAWVSAPARAEIVGNHTDHNGGRVLVSALTRDVLCAAARRKDGLIEIAAEDFRPIRLSIDDLARRERERGRPVALVRGVLARLKERGYPFGGFSAATHSDIFRGAGISSSAAFELAVLEIVQALYPEGGTLSPFDRARIAQYAENEYFGKPCGLLDQLGSALGGLRRIDFANAARPAAAHVPAWQGYSLIMTNTGGSHSALTSHYAAITREMRAVASALGRRTLGECSAEEVYGALPRLRAAAGDRAVLRALHFFEENERVDRAAAALSRGDMPLFLEQIGKSGESSLAFLQNCFVPGETSQPVTLALKLSARLVKDGAFRMQGGGFAGTVLAFVRHGEEERYLRGMAEVFGRENVFPAEVRARGACRLEI